MCGCQIGINKLVPVDISANDVSPRHYQISIQILVVSSVMLVLSSYAANVRSKVKEQAGEEPSKETQEQSTDLLRIFNGMPGLIAPYFCAPGTNGWCVKGHYACRFSLVFVIWRATYGRL